MEHFKDIDLSQFPTNVLMAVSNKIKEEIKKRDRRDGQHKRRAFIKTLNETHLDGGEYSRHLDDYNSSLLSIAAIREKVTVRAEYMRALLRQDWGFLYPSDGDEGDYYVYAHVDPSSRIVKAGGLDIKSFGGTPFYIGKGRGNRAYDLNRNQGHGKKIRAVLRAGWKKEDIVVIAARNLSEGKALEIEAKLIYLFGTIYQPNRVNTCLYNLDIPRIPDYKNAMMSRMTYKERAELLGVTTAARQSVDIG